MKEERLVWGYNKGFGGCELMNLKREKKNE